MISEEIPFTHIISKRNQTNEICNGENDVASRRKKEKHFFLELDGLGEERGVDTFCHNSNRLF